MTSILPTREQIIAAAAVATAAGTAPPPPLPLPSVISSTPPKRGQKRKRPEPKTHHHRISNEIHNAIYRMREQGHKVCEISSVFQLPITTVSGSIIRSRRRGDFHKLSPSHSNKHALSPAEKEFIAKFQDENNAATYKQIQAKLRDELGVTRSIETIRQQLIRDGFSAKVLTLEIIQKTSLTRSIAVRSG